ncbi:hypothetical protein B0J11DRAFT_433822 [Dendryphion nanum]|uniref:Uncharacterized protein n=1 Tax=Dendryphion nanum TaxID=256645 RepID=A0A9P9IKD9_9PLEO|nr:hypothetical protein B0J11DRAFT_433822 [Dendryphion nanum]
MSLLEEQDQDVVNLLSEDIDNNNRYGDIENPATLTLLISFKQIKRLDPLAIEYLSFMACIDATDIPQSLLPPTQSPTKRIEAMSTFISTGIIYDALNIHRLLHLAIRSRLEKEAMLGSWTQRAVGRLKEIFPRCDYKHRAVWRLCLTHIHYVFNCEHVKKYPDSSMMHVWLISQCLHDDRMFHEAKQWHLHTTEARKQIFGVKDSRTVSTLSDVCAVFFHQG